MRLFIAIELPDRIKDYLRYLQECIPPANLSKTHDFHLTLEFLGEVSMRRLNEIIEALNRVHFLHFSAVLDALGTFGGRHPRVVWLSLQAEKELFSLAQAVIHSMRSLGFRPDHRFVPHLTLARVKHIDNLPAFQYGIASLTVKKLSFRVTEFCLFESDLSPRGAVHTILARFPYTPLSRDKEMTH